VFSPPMKAGGFAANWRGRFWTIGDFAGLSDDVPVAVEEDQRHCLAGGNSFGDFTQLSGGFPSPRIGTVGVALPVDDVRTETLPNESKRSAALNSASSVISRS
jgi:hypothetical protein